MKFPNWFRIIWWFLLVIVLAMLLYYRRNALIQGISTTTDNILLGIFTAIMLVPVFSEIEFLGVKLKQELEDLKDEFRVRFGDIKNQIESRQNQSVYTTIQGYPAPASDERLDKLQADLENIIHSKFSETQKKARYETIPGVPEQNINAYKIRFLLERELHRIWGKLDLESSTRGSKFIPYGKLILPLTESGVIDLELGKVLRELLIICSISIHGDELTATQREFLETNWNRIYEILRSI